MMRTSAMTASAGLAAFTIIHDIIGNGHRAKRHARLTRPAAMPSIPRFTASSLTLRSNAISKAAKPCRHYHRR